MDVTFRHEWVRKMAGTLISEVSKKMSEINLLPNETQPSAPVLEEMEAVYGHVEGDYRMVMQLRAEKNFFYRFAENMIGDAPEDWSEVEDYATEFFNVFCGRFVSELYIATGRAARFYPPVYEYPPNVSRVEPTEQVCSLYFVSDKNECAVFSWTAVSKTH